MNDDTEREPNEFEPSEADSNDLESGDLNPSDTESVGADSNDLESGGAELIARLRAADPAAGVEPRAEFADEVLARTLAEPTAASTTDAASAPAPVADLTHERARRRPLWLPLVAVAASLALVGGAGFGIGASMSGATNSADGAAPPISLQSGTGTGAGGTAPEMGPAQNGPVQPGFGGPAGAGGAQSKLSAGAASDMIYPYGPGRNSFSSSGLSSAAGTASAYTYDARASSTAETVAALAAALGVDGTAEIRDGSWQVGSQDGTSPSLMVSLDGTLSFYYSDPRSNPWECGDGTAPCEPPTNLPSEDAAITALRSLIAAAGRDPGAFEFTSESWEGSFTRNAQAWPVVDGKRVDQSWTLEITDAGVVSASGALANIVPLGDYPVISEQDGFKRLSDPRFGAQMTIMPMAMRAQTDVGPTEWVPPTEPPATPATGTSLSWPVNKVDIVSARLGLASQWQPDGSVLIVPAYEFTDAGGGTWSVIAVADSKLDFATK